MLDGLLGTRLLLLTGGTLPLPAGPDVMDAVSKVEVTENVDGEEGFQLELQLTKGALFDYTLIDAFEPFDRVVVTVLFGVLPEVLIDGVVEHVEVVPSNEPGEALLRVKGKCVVEMMALEDKSEPYPNQPDWMIVTQILAGYAQYGIVPLVVPTTDVPIELFRITQQQGTDLAFVRRLAKRNGYVFYVEPTAPGVSTAYWGPENRAGLPQSALTIGMGAATNVKSLQFAVDATAAVAAEATVVEPFLKLSIPIPALPSLKVPPLSTSPIPAARTTKVRDSSKKDPAQAVTAVVAEATNNPDPVTGTGELDVARYGKALRARQLVGVRGAGLRYDGFYYVRRVKHTLAAGSYTQSFTIGRDGLGTTTPFVIP